MDEQPPSQLDRIESVVMQLWARVDNLEKRATFWGALSGIATVVVTRLMGCR